jgi:signal transduction histidine kinase
MAPAREAWLVANAAQQPYVHEHRLRMADGTYRWHLSRANLTREHDAELRWYGTSTDIHERKQTEEQLAATLQLAEEAVQARDHLVSMVSHDLNNPLNVMTMAVTSLQVQLADGAAVAPELLRSVVDLIARQAARMSKLIEELLDVAQLQAGSPLALVRGDTDLVVLTLAIAEEYQRSAPSHRIEVRPRAPSLVGDWDPPRITRVVSNLISNAIKYSPNGGRVLVELAETRDGDHRWAVLTIEDEGIGIAPADLASVFEWFTRGENAQRTHIKGTGIGLAGARDIVMLHGGSIMLASEEGRGSSFTVKLPMPG